MFAIKPSCLTLFTMTDHPHTLPIDVIEPDFHRLIQQQDLVIEAETGSGKSTRLPLWAKQHGRVLVVEPRRIACTSLAQYLAGEMHSELGEQVGYAIKLDVRCNEQTGVVFVTPGVALRWYSENRLSDFDIVMIDEFHERRWDTDLLLAILKGVQAHRIIVTSATLQAEKLAKYVDAIRLSAKGRVYDVERIHIAKDSRFLPDYRSVIDRVCHEVELRFDSCGGDILVFLPGKKEIHQCRDKLMKLGEHLMLVELHAGVNDETRQKALNMQNKQKVVLATNVAETSLTIPNIHLVIDSGLERRTLQRNGRTVLSLKNISQSSATQRAGRAGRIANGTCVHLFGQFAALEPVTPPEMHREDLTEPMLAAANCGYRLHELEFLDELPEKSLDQALEKLITLGAVNNDGQVTNHGKQLYLLPIDSLYADLVTRVKSKASKEAMIDLCSAICIPPTLYTLPTSEDKIEALNGSVIEPCDVSTTLCLMRGQKVEGICVNNDALQEARALSDQIREVFDMPHRDSASRFSPSDFIKEICEIHPELVFVRREKRRAALTNGKFELTVGKQSRLLDSAEAALVFDYLSLPGKGVKQTLTIASVMMPITLSNIVEWQVGESNGVGEWKHAGTAQTDGEVVSTIEYVYAGRVIARKEQSPQGEQVIDAILESIQKGILLPGLYQQKLRQIKDWQLYCELGLASDSNEHGVESDLDIDHWLREQLVSLGVESFDDMTLFEADDFAFEGVPYWEVEDFQAKYPIQVQLPELMLDVEYRVKGKRILLHHSSGPRKTAPKRWELPSWQGWKIQYKKASKVVDVR